MAHLSPHFKLWEPKTSVEGNKPSVEGGLTGASAWNAEGNLLFTVSPQLVLWPITMASSVALSFIDSKRVRGWTIAMIIVLVIFLIYFFRNPAMPIASYAALGRFDMVAPAEGTIGAIDYLDMADVRTSYGDMIGFIKTEAETVATTPDSAVRIVILLSLLDPHVQVIPCDASVKSITYKQGQFQPVMLLQKSASNERAIIELIPDIETAQTANETIPAGLSSFYVVLIAGMLAKTIDIFPNCAAGAELDRGAKMSMIILSSRVDLILPISYTVQCKVGDHVKLGRTVLATITPES